MKSFLLSVFLFLLFVLILGTTNSYSQEKSTVVFPALSNEPLINPGKGWVLFGNANGQPKELVDLCGLGYNRYNWSTIEPKEGEYRWEIIEKDIKSWAAIGRQFAFGIMGANTSSREFWITPKWVFDAGAKYDTYDLVNPKMNTTGVAGKKLVPLFDDPVYMEKLKNLIDAMGKRFDGDPNIAFIDIRSYGNWGEGHMGPFRKHEISTETYKQQIAWFRQAFSKTLLALPGGNKILNDYEWVVEQGITVRRDGICGNSNGSETEACIDKFPGIFELYTTYSSLKELGWWDGIQDKWKRGYKLVDCVERGKPSWCDLSRGYKPAQIFLKEQADLVYKLANRLGYHIVIHKATFPKTITAGKSFTTTIEWENKGVASMFVPAKAAFALISSEHKIISIAHADRSIPREWKSDTPKIVEDSPVFKDVPVGQYQFAVGLLRLEDGNKPVIKLGIDLPVVDGWYLLGTINVK